jgi:hypothetical protein
MTTTYSQSHFSVKFCNLITGILLEGRKKDVFVWFSWETFYVHWVRTLWKTIVLRFWVLFSKFVSSCCTVVYFGKSHKDRVVIVPHIWMIPGLVLPTHLEHELVCNCILNLTPYLLDSESVLNSLPSRLWMHRIPYLLDSSPCWLSVLSSTLPESPWSDVSEVLTILLFNHEVHPTRIQKSWLNN